MRFIDFVIVSVSLCAFKIFGILIKWREPFGNERERRNCGDCGCDTCAAAEFCGIRKK
ncbi:MAG: hypothetical protein LBP79_03085 [Clostridiales bacterium]|nr:hypothetical protein [Clostridiales bacterium]